ncbi:MAG TPA: heat-shock protein, partial [Pseudoxanthomonas sp.]|nr:heat-shock protein [Pseudoxanthomonas sp.]
MRPATTLLALTAAAAFGGFAATGVRDLLDNRAQAAPSAIPAAPAGAPAATGASAGAASLPAAVDGQPLPSLAPM